MTQRKTQSLYAYPIDLDLAKDGVTVTFPDLPEAITGAATEADALAAAVECLEEALAGRINRREPIPEPSPARGRRLISPGAVMAAKAALHGALRSDGIGAEELARRLSWDVQQVRSLLDPKAGSSIEDLELALAALGRRVVISVEAA